MKSVCAQFLSCMNSPSKVQSGVSLQMANEAYYRNQADVYRNSAEYLRMVNQYAVLKETIGECRNEDFIE